MERRRHERGHLHQRRRHPQRTGLDEELGEGDAFIFYSAGDAGYGGPFERPAECVAADVRQGYVSLASTAEVYGVVLDPGGFAIDEALTGWRRCRPATTIANAEQA